MELIMNIKHIRKNRNKRKTIVRDKLRQIKISLHKRTNINDNNN